MFMLHAVGAGDAVSTSKQRVLGVAASVLAAEAFMHASTLAALAGAAVLAAPLPAKLNSIIQPLMGSIRKERQRALQREAACAVAHLLAACVSRTPSPNDRCHANKSIYPVMLGTSDVR